eukprot:m.8572 g.8572  ORF g.8572 m.8572 type:complete len:305 (+) comp6140_c0_seq1:148-1062(+)
MTSSCDYSYYCCGCLLQCLLVFVFVVGCVGASRVNDARFDEQEVEKLEGAHGKEWSACTHLNAYGLNFNSGLAHFLQYSNSNLDTVLEFGCGIGLYVDFLKRKTIARTVIGVEPSPMVFEHSIFTEYSINNTDVNPSQAQVDITIATDKELQRLGLNRRFDLVYSIEVLEHIPREYHDKVADFLVERARGILVFSAAHPNQPGLGHIAERPKEEWIEEFESRGMILLKRATTMVSVLCDSRNVNHKENLIVFASKEWEEEHGELSLVKNVMLHKHLEHFTAKSLWPQLYASYKSNCANVKLRKD